MKLLGTLEFSTRSSLTRVCLECLISHGTTLAIFFHGFWLCHLHVKSVLLTQMVHSRCISASVVGWFGCISL